jgi:hypothetical protein
VTDAQGVNQWQVDAAIQNRYRDTAGSAALFFEAETLTPLSTATATAGPVGASGSGSNVIRHTGVPTAWTGIVKGELVSGPTPLTHVGTFRLKARVLRTSGGDVFLRMRYGPGDFRKRLYSEEVTLVNGVLDNAWQVIDFGEVTIDPVATGPQRWRFDIEAKAPSAGILNIDWVALWPTGEGYAELSAVDQFDDPVLKTNGSAVDDATIGTVVWTAPGSATTSNNTYANASLGIGAQSHYLKVTGWGFSLPATATVRGIVVEVEVLGASEAGAGIIKDNAIRIVKGGAIQATDRSRADVWSPVEGYRSYGSSTDLWGASFLFSDINAATFGVAISAKNTSALGAYLALVDHVRVTVYYTEITDAAVFASQSLEWRGERRAIREDAAGVIWTDVTRHRGSKLLVPPGVSRVMVKGYRDAVGVAGTDPAIDDLTATLFVTPRWVTIPRV